MLKRIAELKINKNSDYDGSIVKALKKAGLTVIEDYSALSDIFYSVAKDCEKEYDIRLKEKKPDKQSITRQEAIEILKRSTSLGYGVVIEDESIKKIEQAIAIAISSIEKVDLAIASIEKITKIEQVINCTPNIQEDVIRYKMICEVLGYE